MAAQIQPHTVKPLLKFCYFCGVLVQSVLYALGSEHHEGRWSASQQSFPSHMQFSVTVHTLFMCLIRTVYECRLSRGNLVIFFTQVNPPTRCFLSFFFFGFSSIHRSAAASCENPCIANKLLHQCSLLLIMLPECI